jgi:hypothetical protein
MTARHHNDEKMLSTRPVYRRIGAGLVVDRCDAAALGARGLQKYLSARRLKDVKNRVRNNAGQTLAVASLVPRPFPFTAFVMAAAALQHSRGRLLVIASATQMVRFTPMDPPRQNVITGTSVRPLEELHGAFVLFSILAFAERSQISALACTGVRFP